MEAHIPQCLSVFTLSSSSSNNMGALWLDRLCLHKISPGPSPDTRALQLCCCYPLMIWIWKVTQIMMLFQESGTFGDYICPWSLASYPCNVRSNSHRLCSSGCHAFPAMMYWNPMTLWTKITLFSLLSSFSKVSCYSTEENNNIDLNTAFGDWCMSELRVTFTLMD